jgi:hypothetical protein
MPSPGREFPEDRRVFVGSVDSTSNHAHEANADNPDSHHVCVSFASNNYYVDNDAGWQPRRLLVILLGA